MTPKSIWCINPVTAGISVNHTGWVPLNPNTDKSKSVFWKYQLHFSCVELHAQFEICLNQRIFTWYCLFVLSATYRQVQNHPGGLLDGHPLHLNQESIQRLAIKNVFRLEATEKATALKQASVNAGLQDKSCLQAKLCMDSKVASQPKWPTKFAMFFLYMQGWWTAPLWNLKECVLISDSVLGNLVNCRSANWQQATPGTGQLPFCLRVAFHCPLVPFGAKSPDMQILFWPKIYVFLENYTNYHQ